MAAYPGFAIDLAPADGSKPPAYGAAFGRREGEALDVVLVIGEDAGCRARNGPRRSLPVNWAPEGVVSCA